MYKVVIILLLAVCPALTAEAQTFLDRLRKPQKNQGTVTVNHDAAIEALVNGPQTGGSAPAQKPKSTGNEKAAAPADNGKTVKTTVRNTAENAAGKERDNRETERESAGTTVGTDNAEARKKVMRKSYKVAGFRVQAFAGGNTRADREKAEQVGEKIKANIPGEPIYVHFYSPRWICRVGNYRTYEEAHQMLQAIRKLGYTQASIVKGKISVQY